MTEHQALDGRVEAVERPAVLLHYQFGKEADASSTSGQSLSDAKGDTDRVPHAALSLDHERFPVPFGQDASQSGNHP
jgi:hypothetical protein